MSEVLPRESRLISGAANGMGEAEARLFAREGAQVVVAELLEAEGHQVAAEITAAGGEARLVRLDVTSGPTRPDDCPGAAGS